MRSQAWAPGPSPSTTSPRRTRCWCWWCAATTRRWTRAVAGGASEGEAWRARGFALRTSAFCLCDTAQCLFDTVYWGRGKKEKAPKNKEVSVFVEALMNCLQSELQAQTKGKPTTGPIGLHGWTSTCDKASMAVSFTPGSLTKLQQ